MTVNNNDSVRRWAKMLAGHYRIIVGYILVALFSVMSLETYAVTTVTVKVTVVRTPCEINNNQPIEVNFGEVMTTRVDGKRYQVPVNYTLKCDGAISNAMKLQIKGNGPAFDSSVLQTNKNGLGIALLEGGTRLPINKWLNFTHPNLPNLSAVLVKQDGVSLSGGEFTATALFKVEYQ